MFPRLAVPVVLFAAFVSSTVPGDDEDWLYREPVRYAENHDPSMVWLEDGVQLQVRYGRISWEEVEAWPKGKELFVAYQPTTGVVLQDPESGRHLPVLAGLEEHPIDILLGRDVDQNGSTLGMVNAIRDATARWDQELNRAYRDVLAARGDRPLDPEDVEVLREAQRQWIRFRDAQTRAIHTFYGKYDGTIYQVIAAERVMDLTRSQALRLNSFRAW